ncbi:GNAT family protein [Tessaracoccus terricola]
MRVSIRPPVPSDLAAHREAVARSLADLNPWSPSEPDVLVDILARQSENYTTRLVICEDDGGIVGTVNISNIVRRRFQNASLGYESYRPYSGTGLMTEGMGLVVAHALAPEPEGLGLHRLEVNVRPENVRSIAMARRLGFRHEGFTPRMLFLDGAWRDHERFALTVEDLPL